MWSIVAICLGLSSCDDPVDPVGECVCCNREAQGLPRAPLDTLSLPQFLSGRPVLVLTPPGYDTTSDRYPVLYTADAQEFFARKDGWYGDRTIPRMIGDKAIPPIIVVAIMSLEGLDRIGDLAPWNDFYMGTAIEGTGDLFLLALRDTLKPEIDARYRTLPDAENTMILGESIAGLLALYAGYAYDSTFAHCAAASPTLAWGRRSELFFGAREKPRLRHLYMDMGTVDDNSIVQMNSVADIFRDQGFVDGVDLMVVVAEGHNHTPACWGERLPGMLRFMQGAP